MKKIAVIAATAVELTGLIELLNARPCPAKFPCDIFAGQHGHNEITLAISGIGTANAAATASSLIHFNMPDILIITGCAGAFPDSGLDIGDLALATTEIFADVGTVTTGGWQSLEFMGIPLLEARGRRYFNEIPLSAELSSVALLFANQQGLKLEDGAFLTVNTCSGTTARGNELTARFGGICENMEGAAVALVAARYGIGCLEVRGISNFVEDRNLSRWEINRAAANAQEFLGSFIKAL